jgi:hypothetical protein
MRQLVILGGGTAGTMAANKLRRKLDRAEWAITVVDRDDTHHYQPGYLFLPFGTYTRDQVVRSRHRFIGDGIDLVLAEIDRVDAAAHTVHLAGGRELAYDQLIIATGCEPRPDMTPGMAEAMAADETTARGGAGVHAAAPGCISSTRWRGRWHCTRRWSGSPAGAWSSTSTSCRSSARWRRWSSPSSPTPTSVSARRGRRWRSSTSHPSTAPSPSRSPRASWARCSRTAASSSRRTSPSSGWTRSFKELVSYDEREVPYDLLVTVPINMGRSTWPGRARRRDELRALSTSTPALVRPRRTSSSWATRATSRRRRPARWPTSRSTCSWSTTGHYRRPAPAAQLRRARQLLHRVRQRQGAAHRLQLRHRATTPASSRSRGRADDAAQGDPANHWPREVDVQVDVLERAAARPPDLPTSSGGNMPRMAGKEFPSPRRAPHPQRPRRCPAPAPDHVPPTSTPRLLTPPVLPDPSIPKF